MNERNKYVFLLFLLLFGCTTRFIMVHEVPQSPTFMVVPLGFKGDDISFANSITEALIANGVKVLERPAMLQKYAELEESKSAEALLWLPGSGLGAGGGTTKGKGEVKVLSDPVGILDNVTCDYVIFVQEKDKWIKIVKRENKQVVFVGKFEENVPSDPLPKFIGKILSKMGIIKK